MSGDDVTGTRQETAADYLRAAADELRRRSRIATAGSGAAMFDVAVARLLSRTALDSCEWPVDPYVGELEEFDVAAAVLGREWTPS